MKGKDNPFYDNHIFRDSDMDRIRITWRDRLRILFHPTYVQIGEGYAFHFKVVGGRHYLLKFEPIPAPPKEG